MRMCDRRAKSVTDCGCDGVRLWWSRNVRRRDWTVLPAVAALSTSARADRVTDIAGHDWVAANRRTAVRAGRFI